ncbi:hypothetical protein ACJA23_02150 [Mycoplasma corogypsi]|uniref:hypothetical protein n=1 Tax=Mycoplasma corogypsi TaxID=2106 RepID=UPI003872F27F
MKNRKFRLILSAGVSLAIIPTMIAASCGSKATTEENTNSETSGDTSNTNADGDKDKTNPSEPTTPETDGQKEPTTPEQPSEPTNPSTDGEKDKTTPSEPTTPEKDGQKEPTTPEQPSEPTNPSTDGEKDKTTPSEPVVDTLAELNKVKETTKNDIDGLNNLSDSAKTELKNNINQATTREAVTAVLTNAKALNTDVLVLVEQVTEYKKVDASALANDNQAKVAYQEALKVAEDLLAENKLKTASTTVAQLTDANTKLKTATDNLKSYTELTASVALLKTELGENSNILVDDLKTNLLAHVDDLLSFNETTSVKAEKAAEIKKLLESLKQLKTLVFESQKVRNDYTKEYYNSSNKAEFDEALNKTFALYPAYNFKTVTPQELEAAITNSESFDPRVWGPVRAEDSLKLVNYVKETDGKVVKAEDASFKSTADVVSKLLANLQAAKNGLDGTTRTDSKAYFKNPHNYTLSWNRYLPSMAIEDLPNIQYILQNDEQSDLQQNGPVDKDVAKKIGGVNDVKTKLTDKLNAYFSQVSNYADLTEKLTKQLGSENFNNVKLDNPVISYKYLYFHKTQSNERIIYLIPSVTFDVKPVDGISSLSESQNTISLVLRNIRNKSVNDGIYPYEHNSVYFTASPAPTTEITAENEKIAREYINLFINYDGPSIPLDASGLTGIGVEEGLNKTVNGTATITNTEFNSKFKNWFLDRNNKFQEMLRRYINKFDNRYKFDNDWYFKKNGIFVAQPDNEIVPAFNLRYRRVDGLSEHFVLQELKGDTGAVYVPLQGRTNEGWVNVFLVRIPLTKFVKPVQTFGTVETAPVAQPENTQPAAAATDNAS